MFARFLFFAEIVQRAENMVIKRLEELLDDSCSYSSIEESIKPANFLHQFFLPPLALSFKLM
jgi:hypothetical protein